MKGLFLKDWYGLLGMYKKNLLLVLVLYATLSMILNMPFFLFMTPWLLGFYTLSSFTLDESCRWNLYACTLPVSASQIVGGKLFAGHILDCARYGLCRPCRSDSLFASPR